MDRPLAAVGRRLTTVRPAALGRQVAAWLVVNSMYAERVQFNMLCEQNVRNVWRKNAFRLLVARCTDVGTTR